MVWIRRSGPHPDREHEPGGEERRPKSIRDLTDPQWYERCAIAKPLFGTTATHAACLFAAWGDAEAKEFLGGVKRNARIMSGNKQVAEAVAAGTLAFGLTDTDDALVEIETRHAGDDRLSGSGGRGRSARCSSPIRSR